MERKLKVGKEARRAVGSDANLREAVIRPWRARLACDFPRLSARHGHLITSVSWGEGNINTVLFFWPACAHKHLGYYYFTTARYRYVCIYLHAEAEENMSIPQADDSSAYANAPEVVVGCRN